MNCAFIISDVTQFIVSKVLQKTFSVFLSFFSRKIVQISIFKVEYLENGVADFNGFGLILQDLERPFR